MQLVQISDLHLGRSFSGLGLPNELRDALARASLDALDQACKLVHERDATALLIPGDLFDRPEVDEELVNQVQTLLGRLERPVLVSPGNHDAFGPMSVWNSAALQRLGLSPWPANVHVFASRALTPHTLLDGELVVYGHRVEGYHSADDSPLTELALESDARFKVLLIHGALEGARYSSRTTVPFTAAQLYDIGADYAAIGHYHRYIRVEHHGRLLGAYAGVAVPGEMGEDPHGGLLVVTLADPGAPGPLRPEDTGPEIEFVEFHPGRIARLSVEGEPAFESDEDTRTRTLTLAAKQGLGLGDVVALSLTGFSAFALDTEAIEEALRSSFRHVTVSDDTEPETTVPVGGPSLQRWGMRCRDADYSPIPMYIGKDAGHAPEDVGHPRVTVESQFILNLQRQIEQCDDPTRATLLKSALRYGRLALRGRTLRPPPTIDETDQSDHNDAD